MLDSKLKPEQSTPLLRGGFVRLCCQLGLELKTGVLTLTSPQDRKELMILREGHIYRPDSGVGQRKLNLLLEKLAIQAKSAKFQPGLPAYPPSVGNSFSLLRWARSHLENQLDSARAQELVAELTGVRLTLVSDLLPPDDFLEPADWRIIRAMREPRRLDQIWPIAQVPRFRMMCFLHFLRFIGAIQESGVAAKNRPYFGTTQRRKEALQVMGLPENTNKQDIRRSYHALTRSLHPDLNPRETPADRLRLKRKLLQVNHAYRELMQP